MGGACSHDIVFPLHVLVEYPKHTSRFDFADEDWQAKDASIASIEMLCNELKVQIMCCISASRQMALKQQYAMQKTEVARVPVIWQAYGRPYIQPAAAMQMTLWTRKPIRLPRP